MKYIVSLFLVTTGLLFSNCSNQKSQASSSCFKGRLEVKGICSNYTIKLLEGNLDASKIEAGWKDETTGKTYTDVFALGSPCSFPSTINAGDEFYFVLDSTKQNCAVCMAYYPTPPKKLSIKVLKNSCN